ncbi:condensation domain-containing protein [Streptomyces sp. NPDC005925]|uniref:condensation domain-containing protein n=1 Tax=Streptomyces sp. NPDC005925 TaxID=3157172 RepID=UPI0033F213DD
MEERVETVDRIDEIARESWERSLGCDVADDTNFFEFGGDSISAILMMSEVNAALGTSLSPHELFDAPDFGAFRALLRTESGAGADTGQAPREEPVAAGTTVTSLFQERWFGLSKERLGNVDVFFEVTGPLDPALFEQALEHLCRRHAVLRSVYEPGNPPVQRTVEDFRPRPRIQDLQGLPGDEVRAAVHAAVERSVRFFDLESEVPFELELLTLSPTEHLIVGHLHHIAIDGWSIALLVDDLERVYHALERGEDPAALEAAPQYGDFAARQRAYATGPGIEESREHWRSVFAGVGGPTRLPATVPPAADTGESSAYVNLLLDTGRADAVRAYAAAGRVTVYNVLLSAFARLLAEITGTDDLLIGTSTAGRHGGADDHCLGVFITPMPLRISLADADTADKLHAQVGDRMRDLAKHRMYPMADLLRSVEPFRGKQLADLFALHFIYQNQPQPSAGNGRVYRQLDFQDAGLERPHQLARPRSRVLRQLEVVVFDRLDGALSLNFAFDPARFAESEVRGWLEAYGAHVDRLVGLAGLVGSTPAERG